jgi:phage tail-like protein
MPTGGRVDPYRAHNFLIEIGGITRAGFRELSGAENGQEMVPYREGNAKDLGVAKLPGLATYSNLTLRWGITTDPDIWAWRKSALEGNVERKNLSIVLLGEDGTEVKRWNVFEAWCSKLTMPSLNATGNEVAIETMEITHERLEEA